MAEDNASSDPDGETDVVYRRIDPDPETTEYDLLDIVAGLEGVEMDALPSLYTAVDHFVETLYQTPPSREAQMEIQFSYAGYRITMDQTGMVKLVPVKDSVGG